MKVIGRQSAYESWEWSGANPNTQPNSAPQPASAGRHMSLFAGEKAFITAVRNVAPVQYSIRYDTINESKFFDVSPNKGTLPTISQVHWQGE